MATAKTKTKAIQVPGDLTRSWGWLLALGVFFIILGCVGLSYNMVVDITLASMFFLGILFGIAGLIQLVDVFKSKHWRGAVSHLLIAILYLIGGGLIIYDPFLASSLITAALAGVLMVIGAGRIGLAFALREIEGWGWLLFGGLSALVLGIFILLQWPFSGLWFIGLFVAIELIITGWSYVFLAFAMRRK